RPVTIENDVNLAAMAEHALGAARGVDDFVLVWMGVGLGLATILGGRLHRGARGAAGEIGYLPVPGVPLPEDLTHPASGGFRSLADGREVRLLAERFGFRAPLAAEGVAAAVAAAQDGSPEGTGFLADLGRRVAVGVAAIAVTLDPQLVVLGGEVGQAGGEGPGPRGKRRGSRDFPVGPQSCPPPG